MLPSNIQEGVPVQRQKRGATAVARADPALPGAGAQHTPLFTEAAQPCLAPDGTRWEPGERILHPALGGALARTKLTSALLKPSVQALFGALVLSTVTY